MKAIKLANTLEAGDVLRYHAAPGVTKQTDAHHQWGVAVLCMYIVANPSRELLRECLLHDTGELIGGDIPFTAKRQSKALARASEAIEDRARASSMIEPRAELGERGHAILKICDTLEGLIWCVNNEPRLLVRGMHRGQVLDRWRDAYKNARQKFRDLLTPGEWLLADSVYSHYIDDNLVPLIFSSSHE